jgi:RNA polymerase sigma-70 factor (ECF subfamily)
VTSALKRARATLERRSPALAAPPEPGSPAETELVERLTRAYESGDLDGIVALLTDDVWLRMPPLPLEYQGRDLAARFFAAVAFRPGRSWRVVATRANRQPAIGVYVADQHSGIWHANGLVVLTLAGSRISAMTRFDNSVLPRFGLPRTLAP